MQLERTKTLLHGTLDKAEPAKALLQVLEAAIELLQIPENDFIWSVFRNQPGRYIT